MAKKTIPASVSLPRDIYNQIEQLAEAAASDNFSRTVSQLVEVGLTALETGWQRPQGWWPSSGRQVLYYYNAEEVEGASEAPKSQMPLPADLL